MKTGGVTEAEAAGAGEPAAAECEPGHGHPGWIWGEPSDGLRFGRIGSEGQSNVKSFPDDAAAQKHADKLILEKTGKGYVEVMVR